MAYALRSEVELPVDQDVSVRGEGKIARAKLSGIALERRMRELGISLEEYRRRTRVLLSGHKIGITTEAEIDSLLALASPKMLELLESTWILVNGKFEGWKVYDGYTIDAFRSFAQKNL